MIETISYQSPLGLIEITADEEAITRLDFVKSSKASDKPKSSILKETLKQLKEYFSKKRSSFDLPLKVDGTDFQKQVWQALQKIPYGQTCTYTDIAKKIKSPQACRAVGQANNRNRIAILIPCHRVIGASGKLVGYAGGMDKKTYLLNLEKR